MVTSISRVSSRLKGFVVAKCSDEAESLLVVGTSVTVRRGVVSGILLTSYLLVLFYTTFCMLSLSVDTSMDELRANIQCNFFVWNSLFF